MLSSDSHRPQPHTAIEVAAVLTEIVAERLGHPVTAEDNIFDLGVDSLLLVDIKEAIRDRLAVTLRFSDFFTHFTCADLAEIVAQRLEVAA